jgi:hypothetical protein
MSRRLALPDVDPSIALTQAARQDFEREFAQRPPVGQLIEHSKNERAGFIETLRRHFIDLLKSNIPNLRRPNAPVRPDV